jgi:serine/threonine protein kinase
VGFDVHGTVKIFDLGFAREEHTIKPTEVAGSLRYMAPEVARGHGSLLVSDVYSFGILLWEICTLDKPYKHINSREEFMESVVFEEWRHTTSKIPSTTLRKLIKLSWQTDPQARPNFSQIVKKLRVEVAVTKASSLGGSVNAVPNKGFGSSANLKRTATWTAKKLSHGISQSTLGVVRMGFRRTGSMSTSSDGGSQPKEGSYSPSTTSATTPSGRVVRIGSRSSNHRSDSPHNPPSAHANATFAAMPLGARARIPSKSSLLGDMKSEMMMGIPEQGHTTARRSNRTGGESKPSPDEGIGNADKNGTDNEGVPTLPAKQASVSLRRGLPSAPLIGH